MIAYEENNHETDGRAACYGYLFWEHPHDSYGGAREKGIRAYVQFHEEVRDHERGRVYVHRDDSGTAP